MRKVFDSTEMRNDLRNNVPPGMRDAYSKVVGAGMKIMFDKSTHQYMVDQLSAEGSMDDKLAEGVVSLMTMLMQNSKGAFPQQLIIPAGIELMLHAADYVAQTTGEAITPEIIGSAIHKFVISIFDRAGIKENMLMGGIDEMERLHNEGAAK